VNGAIGCSEIRITAGPAAGIVVIEADAKIPVATGLIARIGQDTAIDLTVRRNLIVPIAPTALAAGEIGRVSLYYP
jgi:hypothetical protein